MIHIDGTGDHHNGVTPSDLSPPPLSIIKKKTDADSLDFSEYQQKNCTEKNEQPEMSAERVKQNLLGELLQLNQTDIHHTPPHTEAELKQFICSLMRLQHAALHKTNIFEKTTEQSEYDDVEEKIVLEFTRAWNTLNKSVSLIGCGWLMSVNMSVVLVHLLRVLLCMCEHRTQSLGHGLLMVVLRILHTIGTPHRNALAADVVPLGCVQLLCQLLNTARWDIQLTVQAAASLRPLLQAKPHSAHYNTSQVAQALIRCVSRTVRDCSYSHNTIHKCTVKESVLQATDRLQQYVSALQQLLATLTLVCHVSPKANQTFHATHPWHSWLATVFGLFEESHPVMDEVYALLRVTHPVHMLPQYAQHFFQTRSVKRGQPCMGASVDSINVLDWYDTVHACAIQTNTHTHKDCIAQFLTECRLEDLPQTNEQSVLDGCEYAQPYSTRTELHVDWTVHCEQLQLDRVPADVILTHVCAALNSRRTLTLTWGVLPSQDGPHVVRGVLMSSELYSCVCQLVDRLLSDIIQPCVCHSLYKLNRRPVYKQVAVRCLGNNSKTRWSALADLYVLELTITNYCRTYHQLPGGRIYFEVDGQPTLFSMEQAKQHFVQMIKG